MAERLKVGRGESQLGTIAEGTNVICDGGRFAALALPTLPVVDQPHAPRVAGQEGVANPAPRGVVPLRVGRPNPRRGLPPGLGTMDGAPPGPTHEFPASGSRTWA